MPVVRTFISLPAGISGMDVKKFTVYTFIGSFIWSLLLAYIGQKLGDNWDTLGTYFHKFDIVIVLGFVGLAAFYVWHKLSKHQKHKQKHSR
jgi:membrane protein DedA with SNARE-associated domain